MTKPKNILNDPSDAVSEVVSGLLRQYPNRLRKLQNHHVLLRPDVADVPPADVPRQVQILSGGGSGHEPAMAGYIGRGMLSGAILGGIFASPSVSSVLAAIRAAGHGGRPVLLIVMNYTGDRLNFGMACERANAEGIPCRMVVTADDCAVPRTKGITGARGVAGTVLVHKIAGAAAASGKSLEEVASIAESACRFVGTLGVALDAVTVPGADLTNDRLDDDDTIEIGLGIHGEAGLRQERMRSADGIAKEMIDAVRSYGRVADDDAVVPLFERGDDLCLLVNNLGGSSNFELSILAHSTVSLLEATDYGCTVSRVLVGSYMTSFDMHGASVTVLNLSKAPSEITELLDADTDALSWAACDVWNRTTDPRPSFAEVHEVTGDETAAEHPSTLPAVTMPDFESTAKRMLKAAATKLADAEPLLTKYDTIVGDGDCGLTMKRGATEVLDRLSKSDLRTDHPVALFASLADAVSASMGGTSGVLLELMLRKMSTSLARSGDAAIGPGCMHRALQDGVDAVSLYGGATVGSRTMLDALIPAAAALVGGSDGGTAAAAQAARKGADGTADLTVANAGRSNYLSEDQLSGTPDPGAIAVAIVFEALSEV